MARSRNIKPGFFKNEVLGEMPCEERLLFIGLWTLADREGRLEDRPRRIRAELFAFDGFDVDSMLNHLQSNSFLTRYEADGCRFIQIENFVKHQDPHYKEKASEIPPPPGRENLVLATGVTRTQRARILERDGYVCLGCGAKDHLCIDHVLPVSRGGDSSDDNLQTLCLSCNTKKGNKLDGESKNTSRKGSDRLPGPDDSEVESKSNRSRVNKSASSPLNPDTGFLIPDSLIPDSLTGESAPAKRTPPTKPVISKPDDVSEQTWADWLQLRKSKKAPVTVTVVDGAKGEAAKAGMTLEEFLRVWCRRGSQGLEASWLKENERAPPVETPYQRSKRELFEAATGRKPGNAIDITPITLEMQ